MKFSTPSSLATVDTHESKSWGTGANNGAAIDCLMYREAMFHVRVGVIGSSATVTLTVEESDDGSTGWTAVTGATTGALAASQDVGRISVDLEKRKRYLRAVMTNATAASQVAAFCVLAVPKDSREPSDTAQVRV